MTYNVADIAERYAVSEHTVLGWIARGELQAINVGRSLVKKRPRWRITQEALDAFELARTATPPTPKAPRRRRQSEVIQFFK